MLGRFDESDRILAFYKDGTYELTDFDPSNRYDTDNLMLIEKFNPEKVISAIYLDARSGNYYAKRFVIETQTLRNRFQFIREGEGNYLFFITTHQEPTVMLRSGKKKEISEEEVALAERVDVTGWKAVGSKLAGNDLKEVALLNDEAAETGELTLFQ